MKSAIVYISVHHGNTKKVVQAMADACGADIFDLAAGREIDLTGYDLIGFASGVFYWKLHPKLLSFAETTPLPAGQKVFLAVTQGMPWGDYAASLRKCLTAKGASVVGTFRCRGFDTFGPLAKIGGIAKGRPNREELDAARRFARQICR